MPFTSTGADIAMQRNPATGRLDFAWDTVGPNAGNPTYNDDNVHRVMSLLFEHRPAVASASQPASPGWIWDQQGTRGSLLYTVKNVKRSTPSELEAYARDALQRAVDEEWIFDVTVAVYTAGPAPRIEVGWKNPGGNQGGLRIPLAS